MRNTHIPVSYTHLDVYKRQDGDPADNMVRSDNSKFLIQVSGPCGFVKLSQNANAVLGVKYFLIGSGIITKSRERTACNRLIRWVDIENVFRLCVEQPVDFLDIVGHLLKTLIAGSERGFGLLPQGNIAQYSNCLLYTSNN